MKPLLPTLLIIFLVACFAFLPKAPAVNPPPDGGYPGFNTAEGTNALKSLTTGVGNTAVGWFSLFSNTDGGFNTAIGAGTLLFNVGDSAAFEGVDNTAVGAAALLLNTTGQENTASGTAALLNNSIGSTNSAFGAFALNFNVGGSNNTAIGDRALLTNTSGGSNTAVGQAAMLNNDTGSSNIAIGIQALGNNNSGSGNIVLGNIAGTAITTANNVICIGQLGAADVDNRTYIANVGGTTVTGGGTDFVTIDLTTGLLGHLSSSRRYKEKIQPMDEASETLYRLKPVTYRFKKEIDATQGLDYGLIAEDVAEVDPNLAIRDGKGQIESVRYTAINAMLLNEFLKEHRKVEELEATVARQQKSIESKIAEQNGQIEALTSGLRNVTAQIEITKAASEALVSNQ